MDGNRSRELQPAERLNDDTLSLAGARLAALTQIDSNRAPSAQAAKRRLSMWVSPFIVFCSPQF
jgi:hypothetical protein